ncbi:hypothetical protein Godav_017911, partial [Gossypium davidsonii]|nr:hypothetical protein [Gossypium davidsonii]MBA0640242.1 hypothetical protein [Gossypium klotzschianum]
MKQSSDDAVPTAVGLAMIGMEALVTRVQVNTDLQMPKSRTYFMDGYFLVPAVSVVASSSISFHDVGYSIHLGVAVSETGGCYLQQ